MVNGTYMKIHLDSIEPIYIEDVPYNRIERFKKIIAKIGYLDLPMTVQKDTNEDKYWLVAGYPEYVSYKESRTSVAYCLVQTSTDETERRLTLLRRMFSYQSASWLNKHLQIKKLIDEDIAIKKIAEQLGVQKSDIQYYLIHPDIPPEYVQKAFDNKASFPILDKIRRLSLPRTIKDRLYEKAVLPLRHDERLTGDKLQKIKWLIQIDIFHLLHRKFQWRMLQLAMDYKASLIELWYALMTQYLEKEE